MFLKRLLNEEPPEEEPEEDEVEEEAPKDPRSVLLDELGLHHLWYLELRLQHELARANRNDGVFSLLAFELRLLPGEIASPDLLVRCAAGVTRRLRSYDVVAHVDGQRFVAILMDADFNEASSIAQRSKSQLQLVGQSAGRWQAGIATYVTDGREAEALIQAALRRLDEDALAA